MSMTIEKLTACERDDLEMDESGSVTLRIIDAQPAAPARVKVPGEFASWEIGDRVQLSGPLVDAFAAAAREPARTDAEHAVLDAMAGMPEEQLRWTIEMQDDDDAPVVSACRAELARRGVK